MDILWWLLGFALFICLACFITAFICFYRVFYSPERKPLAEGEVDLPPGKEYEPYYEQMTAWTLQTRALPHEDVSITSFDGLTLRGKYYEYAPGAPMELMFHGYRGSSERDLCGGVDRCFALGRNVLIVDHRASGTSEGKVITFGVNESRDCMSWIDFILEKFGADVKIILTGISMGAATVMMATARDLPENVVMVLADCGYTSSKEIIKKVIREMGLPAGLLYPFVKLGARLFGNFDPDELSPIEAMKTCKVPVIFVHGDADDFVPYEMSVQNYEACTAVKKLITVPDAGHGLAYPADCEGYLHVLAQFSSEVGVPTEVVKK